MCSLSTVRQFNGFGRVCALLLRLLLSRLAQLLAWKCIGPQHWCDYYPGCRCSFTSVLGRRPLGAILHLSNEPGELLQWLCHDDSTINIVLDIILYYITAHPFTRAIHFKSTGCYASRQYYGTGTVKINCDRPPRFYSVTTLPINRGVWLAPLYWLYTQTAWLMGIVQYLMMLMKMLMLVGLRRM